MNRKTVARGILIAATALIVVLYYFPLGNVDFANNWRAGSFGFSLRPFSSVVDAVTDPKLVRDGIRPGDTVVVQTLSQGWSPLE
jgi:hypothetical protein